MKGKILATLAILPLWALVRADTPLVSRTVPPPPSSVAEVSVRHDPTLDWAKGLIEDFCARMHTDYGIKLKYCDFSENGSRAQVIQFATELSAAEADMDSFCEQMARKLNPHFQGKVQKRKAVASGRR